MVRNDPVPHLLQRGGCAQITELGPPDPHDARAERDVLALPVTAATHQPQRHNDPPNRQALTVASVAHPEQGIAAQADGLSAWMLAVLTDFTGRAQRGRSHCRPAPRAWPERRLPSFGPRHGPSSASPPSPLALRPRALTSSPCLQITGENAGLRRGYRPCRQTHQRGDCTRRRSPDTSISAAARPEEPRDQPHCTTLLRDRDTPRLMVPHTPAQPSQ